MSRDKKWTEEVIMQGIREVMKELNLEKMPTHRQLEKSKGATFVNAYRKYGGVTYFSERYGILHKLGTEELKDEREMICESIFEELQNGPIRLYNLAIKYNRCEITIKSYLRDYNKRLASGIRIKINKGMVEIIKGTPERNTYHDRIKNQMIKDLKSPIRHTELSDWYIEKYGGYDMALGKVINLANECGISVVRGWIRA